VNWRREVVPTRRLVVDFTDGATADAHDDTPSTGAKQILRGGVGVAPWGVQSDVGARVIVRPFNPVQRARVRCIPACTGGNTMTAEKLVRVSAWRVLSFIVFWPSAQGWLHPHRHPLRQHHDALVIDMQRW
jgi:hypothetical protein